MVEVAGGCADLDGRRQGVAGVVLLRAALERVGLAEMLAAQARIALKAASPEDHALAHLDAHGLALMFDDSADHPVARTDQFDQRRRQPHRSAAAVQRHLQTADKGVALGQEAIRARTQPLADIAVVAPEHAEQDLRPARGPQQQGLGLFEAPVDAAEQRGGGRDGPDGHDVLAQLAAVERHGQVGAKAEFSTRQLRMIVGVGNAQIADGAIVLHPFEHERGLADVALDQAVGHRRIGERADIVEGLGRRIFGAGGLGQMAVGDPDPAARRGRRAAP